METTPVFCRLPVEDLEELRKAAAEFRVSVPLLVRVIVSEKLTQARRDGGRLKFEMGTLEASIE